MLTFEEDDPAEPLELAVKEVTSVVKSAGEKVNLGFVGLSVYFGTGNVLLVSVEVLFVNRSVPLTCVC